MSRKFRASIFAFAFCASTYAAEPAGFWNGAIEVPAPADGPAIPEKPVPGKGLAGEWLGTLEIGPVKLRLSFHVSSDGKDGLVATMDSLDQGGKDIPISKVSESDSDVEMKIAAVGASFKGVLNKDGSAIDGTFSQVGKDFPLKLHRLEKRFVIRRPQEPKPPFPYDAKDITFKNGAVELAGTIITPEGDGPFPAVVFASGSGAQNRDEELMGHKPFLVIADYLARRGIASLRYDDRGFGLSKGDHIGSTMADFAGDVEAGVEFLAVQPEIDPDKVGIVGHSEGGLHGPIAATKNAKIQFLVLLAAPGESLESIIDRQKADQFRALKVPDELVKRSDAASAEEITLVKDESIPSEKLKGMLRARIAKWKTNFTEEELKLLQFDEATLEQQLGVATSPWFRSLIREDPAVHLKKIKIPTLAMVGEKDVQVLARENAEIIERSLQEAGNEDFEVHILPDLNHLFQHCKTGAISEYATIEETISPDALKRIGDWITKRYGGE